MNKWLTTLFSIFCFFLFFLTRRIMKFQTFFFEKRMFEWMNAWIFFKRCTYGYMIFFECIYSACLKDFFWKRKYFYECMIFLIYIYDVCLNEFFLWENAFMKFSNYSFWKYIYECRIFVWNTYIMYVWMILFYFMRKYIDEILDFFFSKMHLWMYDFF